MPLLVVVEEWDRFNHHGRLYGPLTPFLLCQKVPSWLWSTGRVLVIVDSRNYKKTKSLLWRCGISKRSIITCKFFFSLIAPFEFEQDVSTIVANGTGFLDTVFFYKLWGLVVGRKRPNPSRSPTNVDAAILWGFCGLESGTALWSSTKSTPNSPLQAFWCERILWILVKFLNYIEWLKSFTLGLPHSALQAWTAVELRYYTVACNSSFLAAILRKAWVKHAHGFPLDHDWSLLLHCRVLFSLPHSALEVFWRETNATLSFGPPLVSFFFYWSVDCCDDTQAFSLPYSVL